MVRANSTPTSCCCRLVGNFPQASSHLALVNTASNLANYRKPAEQRAERKVAGKAAMQADVT
jgi:hypothetical protein